MRLGKRHHHESDPAGEPVGIEGLSLDDTSDADAGQDGAPAKGDTAGRELPPGVPDLEVLHPNPYLPGGSADTGEGTDATTQLDPAEQEAYAQLKRMRAERRRKRLIKRGIVAGIVVVLVAGFLVWRNVSATQAAPTVQVVTQPVTRGPFTSKVTGSGSIKPISSTVVSPVIDGTIESVNVVAGQQVAAGDVLFTIKNDDLDRAVSEAERNVRSAQSALDQAKRGVSQANQQLKDAKSAKATAERAAKQAQSAAAAAPDAQATPVDTSSAKEAVSSAEQAVSTANEQVESAQTQLETANDSLAKAREQADQRTVRAPVAGSVIELNAQPGAALGQLGATAAQGGGSGALCQIADLSQMTVTVQVGEVDINKVAVDQKGTATFSAVTGASLEATVRSIATTSSSDASPGYGYGGGGGVTYAVDLVIPAPDPRLKPGMTADVSIVTQSIDSALIVPSAAVTDLGDGTGTLSVEDDAETHEGHEVLVKVLATNGSETAVEPTAGSLLAEGENVIVSGAEAASISGDGAASAGGSADAGGSASGSSGTSGGGWTEYDESGNVTSAGGSAQVG